MAKNTTKFLRKWKKRCALYPAKKIGFGHHKMQHSNHDTWKTGNLAIKGLNQGIPHSENRDDKSYSGLELGGDENSGPRA